jgi:fructose-1,6-bisphosphatase II
MDKRLTIEAVRLTEAAALLAARHMGKGDPDSSYWSATQAMMSVVDRMKISGKIVAGAESNQNPLRDGAIVGMGEGSTVEVAVKPLDGKETCARGSSNATSFIAFGSEGSFNPVPAVPMYKIATGSAGKNIINIDQPPEIIIKRIARKKGKYIDDVTVCVLERPWNDALVKEIQQVGARIKYIRDGDISGAIATAMADNAIDLLMGIGWARDSLIAAAALKCLGGDIQGKLVPMEDEHYDQIDRMGLSNNNVYSIEDLVPGNDVIVSATGVTDGVLLPGVKFVPGGSTTESIVMRQKTHTVRFIKTLHQFDFKPVFEG